MSWACAAPLEMAIAAAGDGISWLSLTEQGRRRSFAGEQRRRQFTAGRWLARRLLAQVSGASPESVVLGVDARGRCTAPAPWRVSISHSGGWIGAAVSRDAFAGLDLQIESAARDWRALAGFAGLQPCPDAAHFYRHWTLAEAWLKAHPEIESLSALRGLRWQRDPAGPAWHGQVDDLHWAFAAALAPQWVDLLPQSLQPPGSEGWAPIAA